MNNNIWHSKEFPFGTLKRLVVIHTDDITCGFGFTYAHDMHTRTKTFEQMGIIKWCYLDDLLKQSEELERYKNALDVINEFAESGDLTLAEQTLKNIITSSLSFSL